MDALALIGFFLISLSKAGLTKEEIKKIFGCLSDSFFEYSVEDAKEFIKQFKQHN